MIVRFLEYAAYVFDTRDSDSRRGKIIAVLKLILQYYLKSNKNTIKKEAASILCYYVKRQHMIKYNFIFRIRIKHKKLRLAPRHNFALLFFLFLNVTKGILIKMVNRRQGSYWLEIANVNLIVTCNVLILCGTIICFMKIGDFRFLRTTKRKSWKKYFRR